MPISKDITYTFEVAQGRHIACEHCGKTFTFLMYDTCMGMGSGSVIGSSKKIRAKALEDSRKTIDKTAHDRTKGFALCPHCNMYQVFMVKSERKKRQIAGLIAGTAVGAVPIGIWMFANDALDEFTVWGVMVVCCLLALVTTGPVGWLASFLWPVRVGPHMEPDPGSMTNEEFGKWVAECEAQDADPILSWAASMHPNAGSGKSCLLSLGVIDMTDGDFCGEKYAVSTAMEAVEQDLEEAMDEFLTKK